MSVSASISRGSVALSTSADDVVANDGSAVVLLRVPAVDDAEDVGGHTLRITGRFVGKPGLVFKVKNM